MVVDSVTTWFDLSRSVFISLGAPGLVAVAFLEFFLLPVPPDLVLIALTATRPELGLVYAGLTTLGSVSAGLVGYLIGRRGGRPALAARFSAERLRRGEAAVERHGFLALTAGAFAPIPEGYELLSIASGVFDLDLRTYLLASLAGRGGRYLLEALLVVALGDRVRSLTEVELYTSIGLATVVLGLLYVLGRWWLPVTWRAQGE